MIGCDIVKISRFKKNYDLWIQKVLTEHERAELKTKTNKLEYLSGRWAAKEAIFKCLKKRNCYSILTADNGSPYVLEDSTINVSISHESKYCIAYVLKL
jgi:holo-[acyl-carrier protein] synthase